MLKGKKERSTVKDLESEPAMTLAPLIFRGLKEKNTHNK